MCVAGRGYKERPEKLLADAMARDLRVHIDPAALRLFLLMRWDEVAPLSHAIHDAERDRLKALERPAEP
jgi:hypothetical protein